jgi:hypothetical protein
LLQIWGGKELLLRIGRAVEKKSRAWSKTNSCQVWPQIDARPGHRRTTSVRRGLCSRVNLGARATAVASREDGFPLLLNSMPPEGVFSANIYLHRRHSRVGCTCPSFARVIPLPQAIGVWLFAVLVAYCLYSIIVGGGRAGASTSQLWHQASSLKFDLTHAHFKHLCEVVSFTFMFCCCYYCTTIFTHK